MGVKDFMNRVKDNQVKGSLPEPVQVAEIRIEVMSNNEVRVHQSKPNDLAAIEMLNTAAIILVRKLAQQVNDSRIVAPPPGLKVN